MLTEKLLLKAVCEGWGMATLDSEIPKAGRPRGSLSDLPGRIAVGAPALAVVAVAVIVGEAALAVLLALAAGMAAFEAARLMRDSKDVAIAIGVLSAGVVAATAFEDRTALPVAIVASFGLLVVSTLFEGRASERVAPVVVGTLCVVWIGGGLAHGVLLRELDHGGALVLMVLVGTFVGDTFAHLIGSVWGRTPLAPSISPNKTVEGLAAGLVGGTGAVVALALIAEPWLDAAEASVIGLGVAIAAPCGDLWESAVKREAGVKDTGTLLGAHGGVLDRVDALLFTVPLGYYLALALL
ncbi:MAG: phosphatidate cytidylyltransferase [Actinomycetota bacterium]|nr:phosphatidate cytidylyltransferase [Actinomycetota bacterium]